MQVQDPSLRVSSSFSSCVAPRGAVVNYPVTVNGLPTSRWRGGAAHPPVSMRRHRQQQNRSPLRPRPSTPFTPASQWLSLSRVTAP